MKEPKNNPTEGVTNQTSVNVTEGFNPISSQTNIVLDMVKERFELDISNKNDFLQVLENVEDKKKEDYDYIKFLKEERFHIQFLTDMINNLQRDMEVVK